MRWVDRWFRLRSLARSLSDAQLQEAWRCTTASLSAARDTRTAARLVELRHSYLHELDRRRARGLVR